LICAQERVLKLLRITGLDQVFTVRATLEEALAGDTAEDTDRPAGQTDEAGAAADASDAGSDSGETARGGSESS
jgi:hypothetical protein